ncbi:MAG TPA: SGNH/GDSL hydrolase family protein, partial [Planctomycetota bacterium]|nr:SGNH/GDSL hydrolase family protein [Planctomycetota bacterium]
MGEPSGVGKILGAAAAAGDGGSLPPTMSALRWLAAEIAVVAIVILSIEIASRAAIALAIVPEAELRLRAPLVVRPHPFLGFCLREGAVRAAGTPQEQRIGPHGFRGRALGPKTPETFRIVCLGDSVTYGDALGETETLPFALEAILRAEASKPVEVLNAAVLQATSAETFASTALRLVDLEPDVAVIYEGGNDI